jgi:hypothetical protein
VNVSPPRKTANESSAAFMTRCSITPAVPKSSLSKDFRAESSHCSNWRSCGSPKELFDSGIGWREGAASAGTALFPGRISVSGTVSGAGAVAVPEAGGAAYAPCPDTPIRNATADIAVRDKPISDGWREIRMVGPYGANDGDVTFSPDGLQTAMWFSRNHVLKQDSAILFEVCRGTGDGSLCGGARTCYSIAPSSRSTGRHLCPAAG